MCFKLGTLKSFIRAENGGVAIAVALSAPFLVLSTGVGLEVSRAIEMRQRLQIAVESAAMALSQAQFIETDYENARKEIIEPFIKVNTSGVQNLNIGDIEIDENGDGFARISVEAAIPTNILQLIGFNSFYISAAAQVEYQRPKPVEITFAVDNSPSMLIGATQEDINALEDEFNCSFACHFDDQSPATYEDALAIGINTRLEAAKEAISRAASVAQDDSFNRTSEIYFDIYTYALDIDQVAEGLVGPNLEAEITTLGPLPPNPDDRGIAPFVKTDPTRAFEQLADVMERKLENETEKDHVLIIMTDGVTNYVSGKRVIRPFSESDCRDLLDLDLQVNVVYTTYIPLPDESSWRKQIEPIDPYIEPGLRECASDGFFLEAAFADDIDEAIMRLVQAAIPRPRVTR